MDIIRLQQNNRFDDGIPHVITIGNFDGVHRGHQAILNTLKNKAASIHGKALVLTFDNHPSTILRPANQVKRIYTSGHRNKLLEESGIDSLLHIPFTKEISVQSAEEFLDFIRASVPFHWLILGHDATLGKDRHGDRKRVSDYAKKEGISLEYLDPVTSEGSIISSTKIRELIKQGNLDKASSLLGRPYSIYGKVGQGLGHGKNVLYPTANINLSGLCTPPFGVFAVTASLNGKVYHGVANLGIAPTVRDNKDPVLEIHFFHFDQNIYEHSIEVFFHGFIRPEQKFSTIDELRAQIKLDIQTAHNLLKLSD
jgi:riboflavin kinase/FMN adenylyltransferase